MGERLGVRVSPPHTADVDPAKVASDLNLAAAKLGQANAYRRGLERAVEIAIGPACLGSCFHERCHARRAVVADIRKEIGAKP